MSIISYAVASYLAIFFSFRGETQREKRYSDAHLQVEIAVNPDIADKKSLTL